MPNQLERLEYLKSLRGVTDDDIGAGIVGPSKKKIVGAAIGAWRKAGRIPHNRIEGIIKYFQCESEWFETGVGPAFRNGRVRWMSDEVAECERAKGMLIDPLPEHAERLDRLRLKYAPDFPTELGWSETRWYSELNKPGGLPDRVLDRFLIAIGLKYPTNARTAASAGIQHKRQ